MIPRAHRKRDTLTLDQIAELVEQFREHCQEVRETAQIMLEWNHSITRRFLPEEPRARPSHSVGNTGQGRVSAISPDSELGGKNDGYNSDSGKGERQRGLATDQTSDGANGRPLSFRTLDR